MLILLVKLITYLEGFMKHSDFTNQKHTYGIRKFTTGVGVAVLGTFLFTGLGQTASADEVETAEETATIEEEINSENPAEVVAETSEGVEGEKITNELPVVEEEVTPTEPVEQATEAPMPIEEEINDPTPADEVNEAAVEEQAEEVPSEDFLEETPVEESIEEAPVEDDATENVLEEETQTEVTPVVEDTNVIEEETEKTLVEEEVVEEETPVEEDTAEEVEEYPETANEELEVTHKSRYETGAPFDGAGTEIVQHNPKNNYIYSVNGYETSLDIIDGSTEELKLINQIFLEDYGVEAGDLTSVAVNPSGEYIAVAAPAEVKTDNGQVVFFDYLGKYLNRLTVGALPDMLTYTPDGDSLLVANEGELNDEYTINPPGGISVIDTRKSPQHLTQDDVTTVNVTKEDIPEDFRPLGPNPDEYHLNAEPEYIVVDNNSEYAYVAFQEVSAIGKFNIANKSFERIQSMGYKDHSIPGMGMDVSDEDGGADITPVPVLGMYQPDGIALYEVNGETYIVTANEGDSQDYDGYSEEVRVSDIKDLIQLDAQYYNGFTQEELDDMVANGLFDDDQLGRLTVTLDHPFKTGDIHNAIVSFGARSFSIMRASDMAMIYDSGDEFEKTTLNYIPDWFNVDIEAPDELAMDGRSDNKGPETESVVVGTVGEEQYAFIGSERTGGFFIYNVSNPDATYFVDYVYDASLTDISPEGMDFIAAEDSPEGVPMLAVGHELSGTISLFELTSLLNNDVENGSTDVEDNGTEDVMVDGEDSNDKKPDLDKEDIIKDVSASDSDEVTASNDVSRENTAVTKTSTNARMTADPNLTTAAVSQGTEQSSKKDSQETLPNTGITAPETGVLAAILLGLGGFFTFFRRNRKEQ